MDPTQTTNGQVQGNLLTPQQQQQMQQANALMNNQGGPPSNNPMSGASQLIKALIGGYQAGKLQGQQQNQMQGQGGGTPMAGDGGGGMMGAPMNINPNNPTSSMGGGMPPSAAMSGAGTGALTSPGLGDASGQSLFSGLFPTTPGS